MNLDEQLRSALRRREPSPGFAERVVAKAETRPARPRFRLLWASGAVAAGIALVMVGSAQYHKAQQERAGRQVIQALQIAAEKLNIARSKVLRHDKENQ